MFWNRYVYVLYGRGGGHNILIVREARYEVLSMYIAGDGTGRIEVVTVCRRYAYHQIPKDSGRS